MPIYLNIYNYLNLYKIFLIFRNPLHLVLNLILRRPPKKLMVKTPIGNIEIYIRNFESLKTIFSIFCRKDYYVENKTFHYIDLGANCGYAALYFLSQNHTNTVACYEPDPYNIEFLKKNLKFFKERVQIISSGVGVFSCNTNLYLTEDGKYSSIIETPGLEIKKIKLISLKDILDGLHDRKKLILKIDVEGIETDLIESIKFKNYPNIKKIIVESRECSKLINVTHKRKLINGYVEHIYME